jgi:hypothetical protein
MLLGAAKLLKAREKQLKGTVLLVFQPAEEGGAGARLVGAVEGGRCWIEAGLMEGERCRRRASRSSCLFRGRRDSIRLPPRNHRNIQPPHRPPIHPNQAAT